MTNSFKGKLYNLVKDPTLVISKVISTINYIYYKYTYRDIFNLPRNCEGLLSSKEAILLYKYCLKSKNKGGVILDFGSHKGLSTCILSQAGFKIGKSVIAFEWFKGLPSPKRGLGEEIFFKEKDYLATKTDFEKNIIRWGKPENIRLVEGDCCLTLPEEIKTKRICQYSFAFIDVDLFEVSKNILYWLDSISEGGEIICIHDIHSPGIKLAISNFKDSSKHEVRINYIRGTLMAVLEIRGAK